MRPLKLRLPKKIVGERPLPPSPSILVPLLSNSSWPRRDTGRPFGGHLVVKEVETCDSRRAQCILMSVERQARHLIVSIGGSESPKTWDGSTRWRTWRCRSLGKRQCEELERAPHTQQSCGDGVFILARLPASTWTWRRGSTWSDDLTEFTDRSARSCITHNPHTSDTMFNHSGSEFIVDAKGYGLPTIPNLHLRICGMPSVMPSNERCSDIYVERLEETKCSAWQFAETHR